MYKYPHIYKAGQAQKYFGYGVFWKWMLFSIWHGAVCFFGVEYSFTGSVSSSGRTEEHWFKSTTAFTVIIHIIIYKLFLETVYWNTLSITTCLLCFLLYYFILVLGNFNPFANYFQPQINGQLFIMLGVSKVWLMLVVLPFFALMPDMVYNLFQRLFLPTPTDAVMIMQRKNPGYRYDGFGDYDREVKGVDKEEEEEVTYF